MNKTRTTRKTKNEKKKLKFISYVDQIIRSFLGEDIVNRYCMIEYMAPSESLQLGLDASASFAWASTTVYS